MIYTLTFNPAIDYYIRTNGIVEGAVNRTVRESINFGGKGINVSLVLKELGFSSTALGFIGGFTGVALQDYLIQKGINCDFVTVDGNTRINVKLNDTDINATGPDISNDELLQLYKKLENIKNGDFLVLSGSVPKSLPQDIYQVILEQLKNECINLVVDAENELLLNTLKYEPFLIKPNHYELSSIFGVEIDCFDAALFYAKKLQKQGAKNVMVSMGDKGAVLIDENGKTYTQNAPSGKVISAVGSGDSAVAAFLAEYIKSGNYEKCLQYAVATGSATAFSDGLANCKTIEKFYKNI